jgi:LmbE family N-acetylglucosaminyl deacetylase
MRLVRRLAAAVLVLLLAAPRSALSQERGAVALEQAMRGVTVTSRVLIIGAHPDDEDTQLIAWLARGRGVETAYLALTRGDGGQNIIGNELGEALGAIRTEELLAARRLDGGRQYFTRAFDFGFSKSADETLKHWDRDSLLGDVVTVVRAFRPQVIIAIFSGTPADGHGHHQVSGMLAKEAYDLAGDTARFPAAKYGQPWTPAKFYRNARFGRGPTTLQWNVGEYDVVRGRSYAEIAAESRSMHRSQGQGSLQRKGVALDGVSRIASRVNESTPATAEKSIFDGVDTTFARLAGEASAMNAAALRSIAVRIEAARALLNLRTPELIVANLGRATEAAQAVRAATPRCVAVSRGAITYAKADSPAISCTDEQRDLDASLEILQRRLAEATMTAAGVAFEVTADRELLAFGDSMPVTLTVYNRGKFPVTVIDFAFTGQIDRTVTRLVVAPDSSARVTRQIIGLVDSRPWWIGGRTGDVFPAHQSPADGLGRVSVVSDGTLVPAVAIAEDVRRESNAEVTLSGVFSTVHLNLGPIQYRVADKVFGEQNRPVGGVPPVTMAFDYGLQWVQAGKPIDRLLRLSLKSYSSTSKTLSFNIISPPGIKVDSVPASLVLAPNEDRELFIRIRGTLKPGRYAFGVVAQSETGRSFEGIRTIEYPHIRPIHLYRSSALYLQAVDITIPATLSVAYVQGVGDEVASYLRQLGVPLSVISPEELAVVDLSRYSTLVVGPRAYDAHKALITYNKRVFDFAKNGGTVVVQYGQTEMTRPGVMPYPIALTSPAARVTIEEAPVTVLDAKSRLLNTPNKIVDSDWADWVQERSVYMPSTIDPRYQTPLEMHDPNEPENKGALLMTPLGKGVYVYTTLSLFRQILGGVPGGARLFVNMLSAGLENPAPKKVRP